MPQRGAYPASCSAQVQPPSPQKTSPAARPAADDLDPAVRAALHIAAVRPALVPMRGRPAPARAIAKPYMPEYSTTRKNAAVADAADPSRRRSPAQRSAAEGVLVPAAVVASATGRTA